MGGGGWAVGALVVHAWRQEVHAISCFDGNRPRSLCSGIAAGPSVSEGFRGPCCRVATCAQAWRAGLRRGELARLGVLPCRPSRSSGTHELLLCGGRPSLVWAVRRKRVREKGCTCVASWRETSPCASTAKFRRLENSKAPPDFTCFLSILGMAHKGALANNAKSSCCTLDMALAKMFARRSQSRAPWCALRYPWAVGGGGAQKSHTLATPLLCFACSLRIEPRNRDHSCGSRGLCTLWCQSLERQAQPAPRPTSTQRRRPHACLRRSRSFLPQRSSSDVNGHGLSASSFACHRRPSLAYRLPSSVAAGYQSSNHNIVSAFADCCRPTWAVGRRRCRHR